MFIIVTSVFKCLSQLICAVHDRIAKNPCLFSEQDRTKRCFRSFPKFHEKVLEERFCSAWRLSTKSAHSERHPMINTTHSPACMGLWLDAWARMSWGSLILLLAGPLAIMKCGCRCLQNSKLRERVLLPIANLFRFYCHILLLHSTRWRLSLHGS